MRTSSKLSLTALSVLAIAVLVFPACAKEKIVPNYATGVKVDCGGKQTLRASGSTAQANAMTRFVNAYQKAINDYIACIDKDLDDKISKAGDKLKPQQKLDMQKIEAQKHNAAVDQMQSVADRFNEQVKVYKARAADKKG